MRIARVGVLALIALAGCESVGRDFFGEECGSR